MDLIDLTVYEISSFEQFDTFLILKFCLIIIPTASDQSPFNFFIVNAVKSFRISK